MFKRRRFPVEIILGCVRWYCKYDITYRDVAEMMQERGVEVDELTRGMLYPPKHNIVYGFSIIIKTFRPVQPRDLGRSILAWNPFNSAAPLCNHLLCQTELP
jgi:hypothetical protein